ncbi:hypothetical protein [Massilia haematophila]|uniref:Uncharacterized protein n=1 Tax=Massilia haematophila TaxID=457923 RepID=A0ABV7PPL2_9BURK
MSETLASVKSAPTTTPKETFVEVTHTLTDGVLLYRPDENSFIALYPDEWLACRVDGHQNKTAIEELQDANREVTERSLALHALLEQPNAAKAEIAQARKDLDAALSTLAQKSEAAKQRVQALVSQKVDPKKLVELVPMTMKRIEGPVHTPIYVNAQRLQTALADRRVYLVNGPAERRKPPREKLFNGTQLNTTEVRNRILNQVQDRAKFSKKWKLAPKDADQFSGILTEWAKVMGTSATAWLERSQQEVVEGIFAAETSDPNNPYRNIDVKPEAQFLRWSAGAGAEATFMPFQGNLHDGRDTNWKQRFKRGAKAAQFSIKANAAASFAVGEAKVATTLYLPHAAGWHLENELLGHPLNFGYFRVRGDLTLSALAGASLALEAGAALMITGDKQGVRGTPPNQAGAKAKVGAKGKVDVFAGLKESIDLAGALQWLSPEGIIDPKGPKKPDPNKAIAAYADVAKISVGVSAIQGLAATLGFQCDYRDGRFVIAAKAGACLGLGGAGSVACEVGAAQIGQFFMCIAHQLKQADYKKMVEAMPSTAFEIFNKILYLHTVTGKSIENYVGVKAKAIDDTYRDVVSSISNNGEQLIKMVERQLRSGWGWYAYMPPESRGALIKSIADAYVQQKNPGNLELKTSASYSINELLSTIQSNGQLFNTLDRVNLAFGDESGRNQGIQLINSIVSGTKFDSCIDRCTMQLATATPLLGRAFLRNDEPDFRVAQFPLHNSAYNTA